MWTRQTFSSDPWAIYIFLMLFTKGEIKTQTIERPPWVLAEWGFWGDWCYWSHLGAAVADQMWLAWESLFKIEKKKTYLLKGGRIVVSDFNPLRRKLSLKSFRVFLWKHKVQCLAPITPLYISKAFITRSRACNSVTEPYHIQAHHMIY